MALTVGSLFSGIGGIDLGLERAGMVTQWFCEIDPHCRNVLARHWPGLPIYGDIAAIDWSGVESVDVLAGGFPCQPVSLIGRGRAQNDERWLWPAFRNAISALRPRYVLVENVPGLLQRGLGIVLGDLAALGYDAEWECIPAAAVGAPHVRDRLWLVAYPDDRLWTKRRGTARRTESSADGRTVAHSDRSHVQGFKPQRNDSQDWSEPSQRSTGLFGGARPDRAWPAEPRVGRVAHGVPHRVDRLRSIGNAVVPQVVEYIGRAIVAFDEGREVKAA